MSGASERANGRAGGQVLTSGFLVNLDHSRVVESMIKNEITERTCVSVRDRAGKITKKVEREVNDIRQKEEEQRGEEKGT